jgi:hypothetical protein
VAYQYQVTVDDNQDGTFTAYVDDPGPVDRDGPMRATGSSPIAALRELVRVLADWQQGGSERWLNTPAGTGLARQFCPTFDPRRTGGSA